MYKTGEYVLRPAQNIILISLFEGNDLPMRKTMNIWVLIAMSACVLVAFFWYSGTLSQSIDELNDTYDQTQMRLTELQGEQADLKTQLETVGTDAFIENQARTMYGYMMPDEIRFVITNPEALYGEDEIPSR